MAVTAPAVVLTNISAPTVKVSKAEVSCMIPCTKTSTANSDVLGITTTAPTAAGDTVQKVGVVLTADTVFVNFTGTEILLA